MSFWDDLLHGLNPAEILTDPNKSLSSLGHAVTDAGKSLGVIPNQVAPGAPGSTLDTGQADAARQRMGDFLAQLQQQASTGGGAWEKALRDATQATQNTASALALRPGIGRMQALTMMGNGRAAAAQRAAGQAELLRNQTEQQAQDELTNLYGQQMGLDIGQAENAADVAGGVREANAALTQQAKQNAEGMLSGAGQGAMAGVNAARAHGDGGDGGDAPSMAHGGVVPPHRAIRPALVEEHEHHFEVHNGSHFVAVPKGMTSAEFEKQLRSLKVKKGARLIGPDGKAYAFGSVTPANLREALRLGYRVAR